MEMGGDTGDTDIKGVAGDFKAKTSDRPIPYMEKRAEETPFNSTSIPDEVASAVNKKEYTATVDKIARKVIEQVVWEVVPELAEELIKEEIKRLKGGEG